MPEPLGPGSGAAAPAAGVTTVLCVHQGARVLPATLAALAGQDLDTRMRVVVVCNGCTDASADVARAWAPAFARAGHDYRVLTVSRASRAAALNAAEPLATGARVYLDQDAVVAPGGLQALLRALDGTHHFATLRPVLGAPIPRPVAWYFRAWSRLPYVRTSPVTMGLYAVSARGRSRWGDVPELHSDDKFARLHFAPRERRLLDSHTYRVHGPATLRALVRARTRYARGNRELARRHPELAHRDVARYAGLGRLLATPAGWCRVAVLLTVHAAAALGALLPPQPVDTGRPGERVP